LIFGQQNVVDRGSHLASTSIEADATDTCPKARQRNYADVVSDALICVKTGVEASAFNEDENRSCSQGTRWVSRAEPSAHAASALQ